MPRSQTLTAVAQWRVTLDIPGAPGGTSGPDIEWDTANGGVGDSPFNSVRQGTSPNKTQVLGGPPDYSDYTVARYFDPGQDWAIYRFLEGKQGRLAITAHRQPLDVNGDPTGDVQTGIWTLGSVAPPDSNSNGTDPGMITLVLRGGSWS